MQGPMPFLLPATSVVARPSFFVLHVTPEVTDVTGLYVSSTVPLEHDNSMKRTSCLVLWCILLLLQCPFDGLFPGQPG